MRCLEVNVRKQRHPLRRCIGEKDGQFMDDNTVPVTISRLKKKAAGPGSAEYIKNVRGMGYIWTEDVR